MSRSFTSKLFSAIAALVMLVGAISLLLTGTITHSFAQGTGTITEYPLPTSCSLPLAITEGPDGNVWFTEAGCNSSGGRSQIGKITPSGTITEYPTPTSGSSPEGITTGPDGNLWFTEYNTNNIGKITPSGTITEYPTPTSGSSPGDITTGPDGNLWFTERGGNKIGKITPSGTITEYPIPTSNSEPLGITTGPDGNLWFTEENANNIGQANLSTPSPSPSPSPSPTPVNTQIVWPFQPSGDQWTIVNGYRGFVDHALGGSPNNYAHLAFDFAKCLPNKVNLATGTCDLTNGWANTVGAPVYSPVSGTVAWGDDKCLGLSIDIDGHPGYRIALFHIDPPSGQTWKNFAKRHPHLTKGVDQIGTVSAGGCIGSGNHIHMALYTCTNCQSDPANKRTAVPFSGLWNISGCSYPDDGVTANEYLARLVPCASS